MVYTQIIPHSRGKSVGFTVFVRLQTDAGNENDPEVGKATPDCYKFGEIVLDMPVSAW